MEFEPAQAPGWRRHPGVNPGSGTALCRGMDAFATLAGVYSMPAQPHGAAHVSDPTRSERTRALNRFLGEVELRAFKIARAALRHDDDALDAVQDAMLQLARAYGDKPATEMRPLFYRILSNRIRDMQRRRAVRSRIFAWLPSYLGP